MKLPKYKFDKFPIKINKNEYINQEKNFINFISIDKNILSLYSIWESDLLGVSDLDYLIIFKDSVNIDNILKQSKNYFLIDTVLFININNIEKINYISHHFKYRLAYWQDLQISFDKTNKNLNIIYAWKICFFSLLRNFYYYKTNNKILVKNILSQINDIRYPIFFLKNLWINNYKYNEFLEDFTNYRENYFFHKDYNKLPIYMNTAIKLSWEIIFDLNFFLSKKSLWYCYWRFPTIFINFDKNIDYIKKTEKKIKIIWKISRFLYLPTWFNYKKWEWSLYRDLNMILKNNRNFLNFSFTWFYLRFLLFFKKMLDFISIKIIK